MKRLRIEHYKTFAKADFYTLRFTDQQNCETDDFIQRFINDLIYQNDFSIIVQWLQKMGEMGTLERFFRPERGPCKAIPIYASKLRLYCIRLSDELIILGNGGVKTSQKISNSPELIGPFNTIVQFERMFNKRKSTKEIEVVGRNIQGNLDFYIP